MLEKLKLDKENFGACFGPNKWSHTTDQGVIKSLNPSTEKCLAKVYNASIDDYNLVIESAHCAFLEWRKMPAPRRGEIIRQIADKLRAYKSELGSLITLEMGKSKPEGDGEVQEMIDMADLAVGMSRQLYGKTMHSERDQHRMYEQWHPLGVVGVITAFNFPMAVWSWNAFVGAICGNSIVWKPSSKTPLCTLAVQHICNEVLFENKLPAVFTCWINDDNQKANHMVQDKNIALLSFTGSSSVGKQVAQTVAQRLGKYLLECSGNNAIILTEDADLKLAIPAIVFSAIGTAGQRCTSTRRLIVHEKIVQRVIQLLKDAYAKIKVGSPSALENHMGPLIDNHAVEQFLNAIKSARAQGGEVLFGGNRIDKPGFFVEPALIVSGDDCSVTQEETFGPILYVMRYKHLEDAISINNNVSQGLSSSIFTENLKTAEQFLSSTGSDCGIANVNVGTSGAEIGGAFGGEKETGGGREAGSDSWKAYMRRQTTMINWGDELPLAQGIKFNID